MRRITIRQTRTEHNGAVKERLVHLLATGLERHLQKERALSSNGVDFGANESVTTTGPDGGSSEGRAK